MCKYVWDFGITLGELANVLILGATFYVLLRTLHAVREYTKETAKIRAAAIEQSEAAHRPCLLPEMSPIGDWYPAAADEPLTPKPDWTTVTLGPKLRNVGTGPALKVSFTDADGDILAGKPVPYIFTDQTVDPANWKPSRGVVKIRIVYESVSGRKYETAVKFKDGTAIVGFDFGPYPLKA